MAAEAQNLNLVGALYPLGTTPNPQVPGGESSGLPLTLRMVPGWLPNMCLHTYVLNYFVTQEKISGKKKISSHANT